MKFIKERWLKIRVLCLRRAWATYLSVGEQPTVRAKLKQWHTKASGIDMAGELMEMWFNRKSYK